MISGKLPQLLCISSTAQAWLPSNNRSFCAGPLSVCLPARPSVCGFVFLSAHASVCGFVCLSAHASVCGLVCPSAHAIRVWISVSVCTCNPCVDFMSVCTGIRVWILCRSAHASVCGFVGPSAHASVCGFYVCLHMHPCVDYMSVCTCICVWICLHMHLCGFVCSSAQAWLPSNNRSFVPVLCLSACLHAHPCVDLCFCLLMHLCVDLCVRLLMHPCVDFMSVCTCIRVWILCLSAHPSVCKFVYLSEHPSVREFVCLSGHPSMCGLVSVCTSIRVWIGISVCPYICEFPCLLFCASVRPCVFVCLLKCPFSVLGFYDGPRSASL